MPDRARQPPEMKMTAPCIGCTRGWENVKHPGSGLPWHRDPEGRLYKCAPSGEAQPPEPPASPEGHSYTGDPKHCHQCALRAFVNAGLRERAAERQLTAQAADLARLRDENRAMRRTLMAAASRDGGLRISEAAMRAVTDGDFLVSYEEPANRVTVYVKRQRQDTTKK